FWPFVAPVRPDASPGRRYYGTTTCHDRATLFFTRRRSKSNRRMGDLQFSIRQNCDRRGITPTNANECEARGSKEFSHSHARAPAGRLRLCINWRGNSLFRRDELVHHVPDLLLELALRGAGRLAQARPLRPVSHRLNLREDLRSAARIRLDVTHEVDIDLPRLRILESHLLAAVHHVLHRYPAEVTPHLEIVI